MFRPYLIPISTKSESLRVDPSDNIFFKLPMWLSVHRNPLGILLQRSSNSEEVWPSFCVSNNPQVMAMLLVWEPQFVF
jgi:hypothetical protein